MLIAGSLSDVFHPKTHILPRWGQVSPHNGYHLLCVEQGMGMCAQRAPEYVSLHTMCMCRCCDECPFCDRHDTDNMSRPGRTQRRLCALVGTVGNVSGFVIGGSVLTARTSWRSIHFVVALMVNPAAGAAWFLLPTHTMPAKSQRRGIDVPGVLVLSSGLILFV
ncbi:hypothetical protein BDN71DRAFT_1173255 [Pleurotus eryngii]|uniref:Uncharacterized protein n=1 Tax=Pleurotus eryngii TaxID=5323 RepID=A0A9P5ZTB1_PLEER|nr:hypothetical protein BDN71DRAFT_1173255 [Pleurotus eryngii]